MDSYNLCTDRMMEWFTFNRNKINVYHICKYYIIKRADDKGGRVDRFASAFYFIMIYDLEWE